MSDTQRRIEYMPLEDVAPAARNPKRHRIGALTASVNRFGFVAPVLRDERTGQLVAGHGRLETLAGLREAGTAPPEGVRVDAEGRWLVPVVAGWSSRSDAEAAAYLVADNRQGELGGWDAQELADLLEDLGEDVELLEATGYDSHDLVDMLKGLTPPDLDELAGAVGEPSDSDGWPTVKIKVPHHLFSAWESHLDTFRGDAPAAFAKLLQLDPTPPAPAEAP